MSYIEKPALVECAGDELVAVITLPSRASSSVGLVIVTGGPQYRVGSHRQFVLLARAAASRGYPCIRFDYRGMGDATGAERGFEAVNEDIAAAIGALVGAAPSVERVVLLGLCDGASAACLYSPEDRRIAGAVLLNPWVRTEAGEAKTYLKHYYLKRLCEPEFWRKLWRGGLSIGESLRSFAKAVVRARAGHGGGEAADLPSRMAAAVAKSGVPLLIVLSGRDYVAREFELVTQSHAVWSGLFAAADVERLDEADHTFSSRAFRDDVAERVVRWIESRLSGADETARPAVGM